MLRGCNVALLKGTLRLAVSSRHSSPTIVFSWRIRGQARVPCIGPGPSGPHNCISVDFTRSCFELIHRNCHPVHGSLLPIQMLSSQVAELHTSARFLSAVAVMLHNAVNVALRIPQQMSRRSGLWPLLHTTALSATLKCSCRSAAGPNGSV